jgi:hypothetical protein
MHVSDKGSKRVAGALKFSILFQDKQQAVIPAG